MAEVTCKTHPDAPHGFDRNASHNADRYVCECEGWQPADNAGAVWEGETMVHPPPKQWVGLTDDDYEELLRTRDWGVYLIEAVEAKLKEKNNERR